MSDTNISMSLGPTNLKWFTFSQNNSGGRFVVNDDVDAYVIIQAPDAGTANQLAEGIGIYFDGVDNEHDCECCGDRWCRQNSDDGKDEPEVYGQKVPYSPDSMMTSDRSGERFGLPSGIKVYPYSVINKM